MANPQNPEELLSSILAGEAQEHPPGAGAAPPPGNAASAQAPMARPPRSEMLLAESLRQPEMAPWLEHLSQHLPAVREPELARYFRFALLGVCAGFMERGLSPYLPEHVEIIAPLLADIQGVFDRIQSMNAAYSPEEFCQQAYAYGVHKATYLDWDLYLSKEMY